MVTLLALLLGFFDDRAEARVIVEAAAAIYLRHTQPWFIGLVVHGSALKGGFIPGCSDIDFQLFLDESRVGAFSTAPTRPKRGVWRTGSSP